MLFKLSYNNVRRSYKDYTIYFLTLILGVCIFYVFNSLDSQTAMMAMSESTESIVSLLIYILSGTSYFVSCILGFLILYASRFLIKKRNKEFGIYMLLGMKKSRISTLLLVETLIIGFISLVVGLILGVLLTQVTSILVVNMFEANMSAYHFVFSIRAMLKTILYFAIIYLVVMLFNTFIVSKCKLIDLLTASRKQEIIHLKNPLLSFILFVTSIVMLSVAYYMVTGWYEQLFSYEMSIILVPVTLGCLGTFLFFFSVSGLSFTLISKNKNLYYKGLNSFVYKQLSSKINSMVVSMSTICIMLFLTLCLLSTAFTIKDYFNANLLKFCPCDVQFQTNALAETQSLKTFIEKDNQIIAYIDESIDVKLYRDDHFSYGDSLGSYKKELEKKYPNVDYNAPSVRVMKISDYNAMAKMYSLEEISLKDNEYAIVGNYEVNLYNEVLSRKEKLTIFNQQLSPSRTRVVDGFYIMGANPSELGFFVVNDSMIDTLSINSTSQIYIANYNTKDTTQVKKINKRIINTKDKLPNVDDGDVGYMINTLSDVKDSSVGFSAICVFVGLYLGIIFLISSAAILSLKELSDSIDDSYKYEMLRNIGADEKMISSALFKQSLIFFMMPLLLAIIHTIFGIKFSLLILNALGITTLVKPIICTFLMLIVIYGLYFMVTYLSSLNLIRHKQY